MLAGDMLSGAIELQVTPRGEARFLIVEDSAIHRNMLRH